MKTKPAAADLKRVIPPLRNFLQSLDDLVVDSNNAREHDAVGIDAICDSLQEFGQRLPIIVQKQGMIVRVGNGRVLAARKLGWRFLGCFVVDESEVEAIRYSLTDNKLSDMSRFDAARLSAVLATLSASVQDLSVPGFNNEDLQRIVDSFDGVAAALYTSDDEEDLLSSADAVAVSVVTDHSEQSVSLFYCVIAKMNSEQEQHSLFDELIARGIQCKVTLL